MRFVKANTFFFLIACSLLTSCILGAEEEQFVEVLSIPDTVYKAELHFSYNERTFYPVKDTVFLDGTVSLRFANGEVYGYEVLIDGQSILSGNSNSDFKLKQGEREPGNYQLTLIHHAKAGTGSLADKVGAEYATYKNEYILHVGPKTFQPEITSISVQDGTVQIQWKPYGRGDFQSYSIHKYDNFYSGGAPYRELVVKEQEQTSLVDSTYVGEWVDYTLTVNNGRKLSTKKFGFYFKYEPQLELNKTAEGRLRLSWHKPPFHKNVRDYSVKKGDELIREGISPETLSVEFEGEALFGDLEQYSLLLHAQVDEAEFHADDIYVTSEAITLGKRTPPFHDILHNSNKNAFYLIHETPYNSPWPDGIYKLDENSLEIIDSVRFDPSSSSYPNLLMSPDGRKLFLLYDFRIQEIDAMNLTLGENFHAGQYFHRYRKDDFAVSNNGFIVYHGEYKTLKVLDFATKNILLATEAAGATNISPDGKFFMNGSAVYAFDGNAFIKTDSLPYLGIDYIRILDNEGKVFLATPEKVILYNFLSDTEISSFDFAVPDSNSDHLDLASMIYGANNATGKHFINVETGVRQEIEVYRYGSYILEGDVLFDYSVYKNGYGLKNY